MTDVLHVELREQTGTTATRRLRDKGKTPVVLYGHGEKSVHLSVATSEVSALLRHHGKTVRLEGAANDHALVCQMQWDPLGVEVLHLDLLRVSLEEKVLVTVPLKMYGDAIGVRQGGILLENRHDLQVRCSASAIPDELRIGVEGLQIGHSLHASDVELPPGVQLATAAETVVCHIELPKAGDEAGGAGGAAEPELIGRKKEVEEG